MAAKENSREFFLCEIARTAYLWLESELREPGQLSLERLASNHVAIYHVLRNASGSNVENAPAGGPAITAKQFIGPADGVRREDHVIKRQQGVVRIDGFFLKNSQCGACQS